MGDITGLLSRWAKGDSEAFGALMPVVYDELRKLAGHYLSRERTDHTLQPTALVHEAYLRLAGIRDMELQNRAHFYGAAAQLMRLGERPRKGLAAASCHDAVELQRAMALELDFAVLGPVRATPTHPGAATLGWEGFARIARGASIPVYAIGGMRRADLESAWRAGAHGVAMVNGAWS